MSRPFLFSLLDHNQAVWALSTHHGHILSYRQVMARISHLPAKEGLNWSEMESSLVRTLHFTVRTKGPDTRA